MSEARCYICDTTGPKVIPVKFGEFKECDMCGSCEDMLRETLREAIEEAKEYSHLNAMEVKRYTDYEDITDRVALSGAKADIEELKSLLRWLWNQITEQTLLDLVLVKRGDGPDPVDVRREADGAEQIVDCPEKVRIMELIGIEKEST